MRGMPLLHTKRPWQSGKILLGSRGNLLGITVIVVVVPEKWHHYQCPGEHLEGLEGLMFGVQGI